MIISSVQYKLRLFLLFTYIIRFEVNNLSDQFKLYEEQTSDLCFITVVLYLNKKPQENS